jgi:hypothetical protein
MKLPKLTSARTVSTKLLKGVWKKISDKPFPSIYAYTFDEKDFEHMLKLLQKNPSVIDTTVKEYGVDFNDKYIEACTFVFEEAFIILIKQSADLMESLKHEFVHISKGEFSSWIF